MAQAAGLACRFHGRVSHAEVPRYIAAADICIAPYRTDAFRERLMTFSTLKIPEYMACGRPVVSVPGAGTSRLVTDGVNGFVFSNDLPSWAAFLDTLPARERLASMGAAAEAAAAAVTWAGTAASYMDVCTRVLGRGANSGTARVAGPAGLAH
jgi:glycosyltransferase involved in cell wall biosynthesis